MTNLSSEQEALRASIRKSAVIWGIVLGLIIAGLAYWLLGSQGIGIRSGGAALAGLLSAGLITRKNLSSGAAGAKCANCGAGFSVSRVDRQEVLAKSTPKEERKELDSGDIEITTWVEEIYDVDDTYKCSSCGDTTHKTYQSTRRKDEETVVKSAGKKGADASKGNSHGKAKSASKN